MIFDNFGNNLRVIVVGSSGGIGKALIEHLVESPQVSRIQALSRRGLSHTSPKVTNITFDFTDEASLIAAMRALEEVKPFDLILVATGLLQGEGIAPEKNLRTLSHQGLAKSLEVNMIGPAMDSQIFGSAAKARCKSCLCLLIRARWQYLRQPPRRVVCLSRLKGRTKYDHQDTLD